MMKASNRNARWRKRNPWFVSFRAARQRCNNPSHTFYKDYGGRGIRCLITLKEVKTLWERCHADKMVRPTIERDDSDGDYTFGNCKFIPNSENVAERNRRYFAAKRNEPKEMVSFA